MIRRISIRAQLYALAATAVLPFVAFGGYLLYHDFQEGTRLAGENALTLARTSAVRNQELISDTRALLERLARRQQPLGLDPARCDPFLAEVKALLPRFINTGVIRPDGQVICSAVPQPRDKPASVAHTEWFRRAMAEGAFVVGKPFVGPITGKWVSVLAYPLRGPDQQIAAVFALPLDLERHYPGVHGVELPAGTVLGIVDSEGTIVARAPDPSRWIGKNVRSSAVTPIILARKEGHARATGLDGVDRVWGFAPIAGTDWYAYAGVPAETVLATARAEALNYAVIAAIAGVFVIALVVYISNRITEPVRNVARTARAAAEGKLDRRVPVTGAAEVAEVAAEFNLMLERRAQAEAEILRAKERLDLALESSGLALWDWNIATGEVFLSAEWGGIVGGPLEPTVTTFGSLEQLVHPDDREQIGPLIRGALKGELPDYRAEHRVMMASGDWKWIQSHGKVVERGADGCALRMTGTNADITERRKDQERLAFLAQYDALTGLTNRSLFRDRLELALARARRSERLVGLLFLDLDDFKEINDTLGHKVGDEVLCVVAARLRRCVREVDTVARLGGDEFTVVLEGLAHVDQISAVAEKILATVREPIPVEGRELHTTTSIGITVYPFDVDDLEHLLQNADKAMYQAKRGGRNTYRFYSADAEEHPAAGIETGAAPRP
ncbi:MAG: diguanylate cyclase [Betaproteobacteria bacterium]|nr:diguanylate cyclase [Betaproteobacteria bacterium]